MKIAGGEMKLSKSREIIAAILGYRDFRRKAIEGAPTLPLIGPRMVQGYGKTPFDAGSSCLGLFRKSA